MNNETLILETLQNMQNELQTIATRLVQLETSVNDLIETQGEIRTNVSRLVEWADECGYVVKLPLPKL